MKTLKRLNIKQQLIASTLPKETSLNLSLDETGYKYLDDNYEQSYFEVSLDMIKAMIKSVKSQSDRDWASVMDETEKEAHEEKEWYLKILNEWLKCKQQEEALLQNIYSLISMKDGYFKHDEFVKNLKIYLKEFGNK